MAPNPAMTDEPAFVAEVRAFLDEALTPDLREAGHNTLGVHSDIAACRLWHQRLYARGWVAPAWPKENRVEASRMPRGPKRAPARNWVPKSKGAPMTAKSASIFDQSGS